MKKALTIAAVLVALAVSLPHAVHAVSYPLIEEQREEKAAKGIREKGDTVCLFQSGTGDVRKGIGIGDVLTVYRQQKNGIMQEVGKIRVLSFQGEDYLKGEVAEGEVMNGDVAKKGSIAGLVISSEERCR